MPRLYVEKATVDKHFLKDLIWELEKFVSNTALHGFFPLEHLDMMFDTLRNRSGEKWLLLGAFYFGVWRTYLGEKSRRLSEIG